MAAAVVRIFDLTQSVRADGKVWASPDLWILWVRNVRQVIHWQLQLAPVQPKQLMLCPLAGFVFMQTAVLHLMSRSTIGERTRYAFVNQLQHVPPRHPAKPLRCPSVRGAIRRVLSQYRGGLAGRDIPSTLLPPFHRSAG